MASRTLSAKYSPRVSKALMLYERMLEATGPRRNVLNGWILELIPLMDESEREAYYRHVQILRRSYELRERDEARHPRG